jgi:hypothetical protein
MPTENSEISDLLHGLGREFGATTGRARRCGWHDAVITRTAVMINGIDELALTNLDGLDTVETVKLCVAYECNGIRHEYVPADITVLEHCKRSTGNSPAGKRRPPVRVPGMTCPKMLGVTSKHCRKNAGPASPFFPWVLPGMRLSPFNERQTLKPL